MAEHAIPERCRSGVGNDGRVAPEDLADQEGHVGEHDRRHTPSASSQNRGSRASANVRREPARLALTEGTSVASGVPGGAALIAFVDAAVARDDVATASARETVRAELGEAAMVDAAAVIGNFQRMVRIADGAGIPLDATLRVFTADIRDDLGLEAFGSAANTRAMGRLQRFGARLAQPFVGRFMRRFAGDT